MLRKLATFLSFGFAVTVNAHAGGYFPYKGGAANQIYNLLFCDDLALYKPDPKDTLIQHTLS